jgi:hypothetical protein
MSGHLPEEIVFISTSVDGDSGYSRVFSNCPNRKTNVVNIIGAFSKGKESIGTIDSSLTVDSGWTVSTFGLAEDLATITVRRKSALNSSSAASSLRTIEIERGKCQREHIMNCNEIIGSVKVAEARINDGEMEGSPTDNANMTEINAHNYLWNGKPGLLTLARGQE